MGRIEVQGIVSSKNGLPFVQFRQLDDNGNFLSGWQSEIIEAREMAQQIIEASMNAVYDAALVAFCKEMNSENWEEVASKMLTAIRQFRSDHWGLPDQPEDWNTNKDN